MKWLKGSEMSADDAIARYWASMKRRGLADGAQQPQGSPEFVDGWFTLDDNGGNVIAWVNEDTGYVKLNA